MQGYRAEKAALCRRLRYQSVTHASVVELHPDTSFLCHTRVLLQHILSQQDMRVRQDLEVFCRPHVDRTRGIPLRHKAKQRIECPLPCSHGASEDRSSTPVGWAQCPDTQMGFTQDPI